MRTTCIFLFLINLGVVYAQKPFVNEYSPDSITIDFSTFNTQDTLKIMGLIADGGEFCQHKEYITVYRTANEITASLYREEPCVPEIFLADGTSIYNEQVSIDQNHKKELLSYIKSFRDFPSSSTSVSNAATYFTIYYQNRIYLRNDPSGKWNCFIDLRNSLFKK